MSTKPSKLSALAAARKKKEEEKKTNLTLGNKNEEITDPKAASLALLDRLSDNLKLSGNTSKKEVPDDTAKSSKADNLVNSFKNRKYQSSLRKNHEIDVNPKSNESTTTESHKETESSCEKDVQNLRASPSNFAATIIGKEDVAGNPAQRSRGSDVLNISISKDTKFNT